MERSADRIITTHVGSLVRPRALLETMREKEHGRTYDGQVFDQQVADAVKSVVAAQAAAGIDVANDGEQGKANSFTYVLERLEGTDDPGGIAGRRPNCVGAGE